jgi:hypothetical protein
LFRFDAGWLFLMAGLAMLAAIVLVPEQDELSVQASRLHRLQWEEGVQNEKMRRYAFALHLLHEADPELAERLIESRLRRVRVGRDVHLIADTVNAPISDWVDALGVAPAPEAFEPVPTLLASMMGSGARLWLLGGATLSIFIGLVLGGAGEPLLADFARKLVGRSPDPNSGAAEPHIFDTSDEGDPETLSGGRFEEETSEWAPRPSATN